MIINNNKLNSLPKQVEVNMENIEILANYLKDVYKTSLELNKTDVSIAISNTNAPVDTKDGWLLDSRGLLFHITGGDGTNLLLDFYTDMKGEKGDSGSSGASSNDKGTYITHVDPIEIDGVYVTSTNYIDNISNDDIPIQENDIIIYIDSNDEPTYVFLVTSINDTTLSLTKTGTYSKGKKMYLHNIVLRDGTYKQFISFIIINDDITPFTKETLTNYIYDNFDSNHLCPCSGSFYYSSVLHIANGFCINDTGGIKYIRISGANSDGTQNNANQDITTLETFLLNEKIISLN